MTPPSDRNNIAAAVMVACARSLLTDMTFVAKWPDEEVMAQWTQADDALRKLAKTLEARNAAS